MKLRESIENYQPFDNDEEEIKSRIIRNMDIYPDVLTRDNDKCHFAIFYIKHNIMCKISRTSKIRLHRCNPKYLCLFRYFFI